MDSHAVASICMAQFSFPNESPCVFAFIGDMKSVVGEWMPSHAWALFLDKVIGPGRAWVLTRPGIEARVFTQHN